MSWFWYEAYVKGLQQDDLVTEGAWLVFNVVDMFHMIYVGYTGCHLKGKDRGAQNPKLHVKGFTRHVVYGCSIVFCDRKMPGWLSIV